MTSDRGREDSMRVRPGRGAVDRAAEREGPEYSLTSVIMSFAKSRERSGVTKQDRPVRATPVSYWFGLLRS